MESGHEPGALRDAADPALSRWCGETMAGLHAAAAPRRAPGSWPLSIGQTLDELSQHLSTLSKASVLARGHARRLRWLAAGMRPAAARRVIVHRDLWWGNVVGVDGGDWRVVDNASLDLGMAAFDLARTRYRWPGSGRAWTAFLDGYATVGDPAAYLDHAAFWDAVVLDEVATFRRSGRTGGVRRPLALLRALASPIELAGPNAGPSDLVSVPFVQGEDSDSIGGQRP